jgi:hypothetical protein
VKGRPKKVARGIDEMPAAPPLVRSTQLIRHEADDLAEGERHDAR